MNFIRLEIENNFFVNVNIETKKVIRINNDDDLSRTIDALGYDKIAEKLINFYNSNYRDSIKISQKSLAIEIQGHFIPDTIINKLLEFQLPKPIEDFEKKIKSHTEVIDCGESDVDSNRWIWDLFDI